MSQRFGSETAHFEIVFHDGEVITQGMRQWFKEAPLIFKARSPGQDTAGVQPFAADLEKHILGPDPFCRAGIMGTARSMDVMISAKEPIIHWIDPTFQAESGFGRVARR